MEAVRRVVRLGRAGRNRANVKTRQPLARVKIVPPAGESALGDFTEIALEELNVKEAEPVEPGTALAELAAKARFDVLGPRFGKDMKKVAAAIDALAVEQVVALERTGEATVEVEGTAHTIRREEVQVTHADPPGWIMEREAGWSVALDLEITEELRLEGFARELVNKIQFMRRQADFGITDRIEILYEGTDILREAVDRHAELIRGELRKCGTLLVCEQGVRARVGLHRRDGSRGDRRMEDQRGARRSPSAEGRMRSSSLFYVVAAVVLVLDQWTKLRIVDTMFRGESISVLGEFFRITYVQNAGAAFGLDLGGRWSFIVVTIVVAAFILLYFARTESTLTARWALALILGGALGNLVDRIRIGEVVDFLHLSVAGVSWPIFNVADIGVCVGVGLLAIHLFRKEHPEDAAEPAGSQSPDAVGEEGRPA